MPEGEKAGIFREYQQHFLLDEGKLRKIHDILVAHAAKLDEPTFTSFYVARDNDSFFETRDIEEVLSDDNTPGRLIKTVGIELHREQDAGEDHRLRPEPEPESDCRRLVLTVQGGARDVLRPGERTRLVFLVG